MIDLGLLTLLHRNSAWDSSMASLVLSRSLSKELNKKEPPVSSKDLVKALQVSLSSLELVYMACLVMR
jgi:hypothetical protein